jgi:uncharacterized protein YkwD
LKKRTVLMFALLTPLCFMGAQCGSPSRGPTRALTSKKVDVTAVTGVAGSGVTLDENNFYPPAGPTQELWEMVNGFRQNHFLKPLAWHQVLAGCAARHNNLMVNNDFFSLVAPNGVDVFERVADSTGFFIGIPTPTSCQYFIAQGTDSPNDLFSFMKGEGAVKAMLEFANFDNFGVAYNPGYGGTWTVVFSD